LSSKDTQFPEGTSGNPSGRPKGSKNKITLLKQMLEVQLREAAKVDMPAVLQKATELALQGDRTMLKLLLELHMSKGYATDEKASEKVEINISTQTAAPAPAPSVEVATTILEDSANG
jgi:hypothetical protein